EEHDADVFLIVDPTEDHCLAQATQCGTLNLVECPRCKRPTRPPYPVLVLQAREIPLEVARSALSYQGRKAVKDAPVLERMRELSAQYPRYGYRRIRIFLGRDGYRMSPGRAYRLWRAAGLQLPRKRPKKRVAAARPRPQAPCGP